AAHLGAARTQRPRLRVVPRDAARVVVDAHEIERRANRLEVGWAMFGPCLAVDRGQLVGIATEEQWIHELTVHVRVRAARGRDVEWSIRRRVLELEVDHDAERPHADRAADL